MKKYKRISRVTVLIVLLLFISFLTSSCFLLLPLDRFKSDDESESQSEIIISRSDEETSSDPITSDAPSKDSSSDPITSEDSSQESLVSNNDSGESDDYSESIPDSEVSDSPSDDEYVKGTLTSNSLKSEYLNISFTAPAGYIMATEEEIDSLVSFAGEIIFKDQDQEIIDYSKANSVYEMFVQNPSGLPNMSIIVEKITSGITYDDYINALKYQMANVDDMEYNFSASTSDASVAGNTYKKLSAQLEYMEIEMKQDFYMRIKGDRLISITMTYSNDTESDANKLINAIKAYQ